MGSDRKLRGEETKSLLVASSLSPGRFWISVGSSDLEFLEERVCLCWHCYVDWAARDFCLTQGPGPGRGMHFLSELDFREKLKCRYAGIHRAREEK